MKVDKKKEIIGRKEFVDLPDFGLFNIEVKIDSGAYSSSIHVSHCQEIINNNEKYLEVVFLDESYEKFSPKVYLFSNYRNKSVKNSSGQSQIRYFIKAKLIINKRTFITEFSITLRDGMKSPVLIGRKVLNNRFIIDPSLKHITNNHQ